MTITKIKHFWHANCIISFFLICVLDWKKKKQVETIIWTIIWRQWPINVSFTWNKKCFLQILTNSNSHSAALTEPSLSQVIWLQNISILFLYLLLFQMAREFSRKIRIFEWQIEMWPECDSKDGARPLGDCHISWI